jgi:hypothetical protein
MLGMFRRPKLDARFAATHAHTDEFAREVAVAGRLALSNAGSDAEIDQVDLVLIAGFRRIPLEVPTDWRSFRLASGATKEADVSWTLTLDAPLRAEKGELYVSLHDQKRRKSEWRLPFKLESR